MKRFTLATIAIALFAAGCGGGTSSPTPTITSHLVFTADLRASNEVPPIQGAEASGTGSATITFDVTRDPAGNVTSGVATFVVTLSGLPAGTPINIAHIHTGGAGVGGAVVFSTSLVAGEVVTNASGSASFTKTNITPAGDLAIFNSIINNPSGFYFNAHSALNPGGVVRGQLVRQ